MKRLLGFLFVLIGPSLAFGSVALAQALPLTHPEQIGPAIRSCWVPPPISSEQNPLEMTIRFSLKSDGSLLGRPQITYVTQSASPERQREIVASVFRAFQKCLPLKLDATLGNAIAGRAITSRFQVKPKKQINPNKKEQIDL